LGTTLQGAKVQKKNEYSKQIPHFVRNDDINGKGQGKNRAQLPAPYFSSIPRATPVIPKKQSD